MKKIAHLFYIIWVFFVFSTTMIFYFPFIFIPYLFGDAVSIIGNKMLQVWSWTFSVLTRIRYSMHGRQFIDAKKTYIYISNHTSYLDVPGLRMLIPNKLRPLAKKELSRIPLFGFIAGIAGILIDRSSPSSRFESLQRIKYFIERKSSVLIFPEGSQNRTQEILQPFKDGAFKIAIQTQTPLLPIIILGAGRLMPPGTIRLRPGKIIIRAMQEISTQGLTMKDVKLLKERTFEVMRQNILQYGADAVMPS